MDYKTLLYNERYIILKIGLIAPHDKLYPNFDW